MMRFGLCSISVASVRSLKTSLTTTGLRPMRFFHPYHTTRSGFHGIESIADLYYRCRTEIVLRLASTLFSCSGAASAKVAATSTSPVPPYLGRGLFFFAPDGRGGWVR
ncbi:hypothetical protein V8E53_015203 [Lactarius tabidus]